MKTLQLLSLFIIHYAFIYGQNVGIGTTTPKVKLHVLKGVQTVAPFTGSTMAVQSDGETFLQILSNDVADQNGIIFGHTTQPNSAGITFNFSGSRELAFFTNASAPSLILNNQGKVGIGTISPVALLQVADSNVLFTGPATVPTTTNYNPPVQGAGTRMMWYPQRAAFRVGGVDGTQWDKNNIGLYSFATGYNSIASFNDCVAIGFGNTASNANSIAIGNNNISNGSSSMIIGSSNSTTADFAKVLGTNTQANSAYETITGRWNKTDGNFTNSWVATDRLFVIGNGVDAANKSDAFVVIKNGNTGIGTSRPSARLQVADSNLLFTGPATVPVSTTYSPPMQGAGTRMMWYPQKAAFRVGNVSGSQWDKNNIGHYSLAFGYNTTASGKFSTALGNAAVASAYTSTAIGESTTASGDNATAMGASTIASGGASTAMGVFTTASGANSTAIGYATIASGDGSTTVGVFTTAKSADEIAIGAFNTDYTPLSSIDWNAADRLFVIGNGANAAAKSDAMVVLKNGNTGIGVSAPHAQLQLATTLANRKIVLYEVADNDHQFQGFGMNNGVLRYQVNQTGDDHVFYAGISATTSNELMRIKGNGNVGINSNSPTAKLQVSGSFLVDGTQFNHSAQGAYLEWNRDGGSGKTFILNQKGLGSGGIVFGDINNTNFMIEHLRLDYNGNATLAGVLTQNSDERLKTNIHPLSSSLQNLQQLNGYTYNWKDKTRDNDLQVGVLAQEVQKIYPQLVKTAADGTLSVNYSGFVPVLIEGMKEQQKQIEELKQLVKTLTNK